jgi:hypothetical protein
MLYFFLLFAPPSAPACVLWIDHLPIPNNYLPPICPIETMPSWDSYNLRLIDGNGSTLCEWPASVSLSNPPCKPSPPNNYHIEVWLKSDISVCSIKSSDKQLTDAIVQSQCPELLEEYKERKLEIRGPFEVDTPIPQSTDCTLAPVDNSIPLESHINYQFLAGRLSWWGIDILADDWQNRFDDQIRASAIDAGVPAGILKSMIAQESQFWPLWTGDAGEVGWMQVTWDGSDTALRHDRELFDHYCPLAIWSKDCSNGYDLLTADQQLRVRSELIKDLEVYGIPMDAAAMAADDLWIYAHILRAYACQAQELYPDRDVWMSAIMIYNSGTHCIQDNVICSQGQLYLNEVMKYVTNDLNNNISSNPDWIR